MPRRGGTTLAAVALLSVLLLALAAAPARAATPYALMAPLVAAWRTNAAISTWLAPAVGPGVFSLVQGSNPCDGTWAGVTCAAGAVTGISLAGQLLAGTVRGDGDGGGGSCRRLRAIACSGLACVGSGAYVFETPPRPKKNSSQPSWA